MKNLSIVNLFHHPLSPSHEYHFSAFKIPFGYAIYTLPYTIHADCFLTGNYYVAYSFTEDYSTVRFVKSDGSMAEMLIG